MTEFVNNIKVQSEVQSEIRNGITDISEQININKENIDRLFSKNQILSEFVNDQHKDMSNKYDDLLKENERLLGYIMDIKKTYWVLAFADILTLIILVVHIIMNM